MGSSGRLAVRVNDELVLDTGVWDPLDRRRVTPAKVRALLRFSADGMALGMAVSQQLAMERPRRPWPEQVLPYRLATMMLVTPSGWTLSEVSREVRLPGRLEASALP